MDEHSSESNDFNLKMDEHSSESLFNKIHRILGEHSSESFAFKFCLFLSPYSTMVTIGNGYNGRIPNLKVMIREYSSMRIIILIYKD